MNFAKNTNRSFSFLAGVCVAVAGIAVGISLAGQRASFPPHDNACYAMAIESLESLRMRGEVTVPEYTAQMVTRMRCQAVPGLIHFEIEGADSDGADFQLYYAAGGMAASGADTVSDFCYIRNGKMVSGRRVTGRESVSSAPQCRFDPISSGDHMGNVAQYIFRDM